MTHELPELGYEYNALEPHIDAKTMEIHHTKHHAGYVAKLNAALEKYPELQDKTISELIAGLNALPADIKTAVRNNGGGHLNHSMFWDLLKKDVAFEGELAEAIKEKWGTFEKFKEEFINAALTIFGSGWMWLVLDGSNLEIVKSANQDNPLTEAKNPILGVDMWEHSMYLKFQNRKNEYLDAIFEVINWKQAEHNFKAAKE